MPQHNEPLQGVQSNMIVALAPKEQRTENFPLAPLVDLPKEGGTFEIRIGRGLVNLPNDPSRLDPSKMIWCEPERVTFPPPPPAASQCS